ncbi:Proliferation-associated nucleolar protein (NOL1) [Trachipleistophora hominis]|uniref:Proliferation-associated nucleolar protein (NOL1) n=1 Tax=Trachipleistophora hominis TaxID=72359 RepID=L7JYL5_TRAHO|nr:Proliferation-associated nucleolar protein (NOL1) [Trachipleistophora hominis]
MYEHISVKLQKIMNNTHKLSYYRKDEHFKLLRGTITNRKSIETIISLSGYKPRNKYASMLMVQDVVYNGKQEGTNCNFVKNLVIPSQYVRINTLAEGCTYNGEFNYNNGKKETDTTRNETLPDNSTLSDNNYNKKNDSETGKRSHVHGYLLNHEQYNLITSRELQSTAVPFVYKVPLSVHLRLSPARQYIIQSLPTTLPPYILNPPFNSTVIDTCASPGNKTSHLSAIMNNTGLIYAVEKDFKRYKILKQNLELCNVKNVKTMNNDFLELNLNAEYLLVDPSCSGSGIHNDYVKNHNRVKLLSSFQKKILIHALNTSGAKRVVYSTCSSHKEENEIVVDHVLKDEKLAEMWRLDEIRCPYGTKGIEGYLCSESVLRFERGEHIGFFIALFVRKNANLQ